MTVENLSTRDKKHLWHPLTQHKLGKPQLPIVKAKGALLFDEKGKEYIDAIASWYTVMYGHANEQIVSAITQQMQTLDFVMFSGLTHEPAIELSEKLMEILKKQKNLFDKFKSTNHIIIDVPKKTNKEIWDNIANTIEAACRNL